MTRVRKEFQNLFTNKIEEIMIEMIVFHSGNPA